MNRIELDIRHIHTVKALHIYLAYCLDLPDYYGKNLDALYDVLSTESREILLSIRGAKETQCELAAYAPRLIRVIEDAAEVNDRIHIEMK